MKTQNVVGAAGFLAAATAVAAGASNWQAGTLTNAPNAVAIGGIGVGSVLLLLLSWLWPGLAKILEKLKDDQPDAGTPSPKTELRTSPRVLHPQIVDRPLTPAVLYSNDGRILLQDVEQRDIDALHHLAERAATIEDAKLRDEMLGFCRGLSGSLFTLHHGVPVIPPPTNSKIPETRGS